jgi:hypothetical protein
MSLCLLMLGSSNMQHQAHIYNSSKLYLISATVGGCQSDYSALGKGKFCISLLISLYMVS